MIRGLKARLLALQQADLQLRAELQAAGSLFDGYHPRMEALHRANAQALREVLARHGWPDEKRAGVAGAEAAWLVAQHAISEPEFMRQCREHLAAASLAGRVPRWQYAYLDDRIRVFEGRPQRYGTQFDLTPQGPVLEPVEDAAQLDRWRQQAGLDPVAAAQARQAGNPWPTPAAYAARQQLAAAWRVQVGWRPAGGPGNEAQAPSMLST